MKTKRQPFDDRIRFSWGFHDAVSDAERGQPRLTHSDVHDVRHVSPTFDKAYHDGYEYGLEYVRLGMPTSTSQFAWESHQRGVWVKADAPRYPNNEQRADQHIDRQS